MAVDLWHRHSNESERANWDIYDAFKLKKTFDFHGLYKNNSVSRWLRMRGDVDLRRCELRDSPQRPLHRVQKQSGARNSRVVRGDAWWSFSCRASPWGGLDPRLSGDWLRGDPDSQGGGSSPRGVLSQWFAAVLEMENACSQSLSDVLHGSPPCPRGPAVTWNHLQGHLYDDL